MNDLEQIFNTFPILHVPPSFYDSLTFDRNLNNSIFLFFARDRTKEESSLKIFFFTVSDSKDKFRT